MKTEIKNFLHAKKLIDEQVDHASRLYIEAVQEIANHCRVHIVTGQMSDIWQVGERWGEFKMEDDNCSRKERAAHKALEKLDAAASEINIGPSNMERFSPKQIEIVTQ